MLDIIKIGHVTDIQKQTGTTVILFDQMIPCAKFTAGSASATRETELLSVDSFMPSVNAISLSGGSAFGLAAADGVMQFLKEKSQGFPTMHGVVPIVPAAALYDFSAESNQAPDANMGYQACLNAKVGNFQSGRLGAATAATVGKFFPQYQPTQSGFGIATYQHHNGLEVLACAAVNAAGEILDKQGHILAGAKDEQGQFFNMSEAIFNGQTIQTDLQTNTTLVAVITNAMVDKAALSRIAKVAATGMARAISPCFTLFDGDIVFAAATGACQADETAVSVIAAELVQEAIINAVK